MFKWAKEQKIHDAGFAKGLMFGKAVATRDEQERIIKLLEGKKASEIIYTTHPIEADCDVIYRLILLIKGEK